MPNEHDKQISAFRRWIHDKANGGPVWGAASLAQGLPTRLPNAELFNVYEAHTKNCKTCLTAMRNIKLVRNLSAMAVVILSFTMKNVKGIIVGSLMTAISIACHKLLKLFRLFEFSHQDNN
jgi:hypothetical protein